MGTDQGREKRGRSVGAFLLGCLTGAGILGLLYVIGGQPSRAPSTESIPSGLPDAGVLSPTLPGDPSIENQSRLPYAIEGLVTDDREDPVAGARIRVANEARTRIMEAESDSEGRFRVTGVALGVYTVEVEAEHFRPASRSGVTPGGRELRIELEPTADLVGRVEHDGVGLPDVEILVGGPGLFPPLSVISGADGRFVLEGLSAHGHLELAALGHDLGSGFGVEVTPAEQTQVIVPLRDAPPLRLSVEGPGGAPVAHGALSISAGSLHVLSVSELVEQGRVQIRGLPPGTYYARVHAPGYLPWDGPLAHGGEAPQSIRLERGRSIAGLVLDGQGAPLAEVRIDAEVRDASGHRIVLPGLDDGRVGQLVRANGTPIWPPAYEITSGQDGGFEVSGLPEGRVTLTAELAGYGLARTDPIEVSGEEPTPRVEIRLGRQ